MSWAGKQHPVEVAVEWIAPIPLAFAVGWAGGRLGLSSIEAMALGSQSSRLRFAAVRTGGGTGSVALQGFEPADFTSVELDELVLDEMDALLELSDRLMSPTGLARCPPVCSGGADAGRIGRAHRLLSRRRRSARPAESSAAEISRLPDASAALHDALANIRASLR